MLDRSEAVSTVEDEGIGTRLARLVHPGRAALQCRSSQRRSRPMADSPGVRSCPPLSAGHSMQPIDRRKSLSRMGPRRWHAPCCLLRQAPLPVRRSFCGATREVESDAGSCEDARSRGARTRAATGISHALVTEHTNRGGLKSPLTNEPLYAHQSLTFSQCESQVLLLTHWSQIRVLSGHNGSCDPSQW